MAINETAIMTTTDDPCISCEAYLRKDRNYNAAHAIWPSVNRIIDRMLARSVELRAVYAELVTKLNPSAVERFLSLTTEVLAIWNPDYLERARAGRDRHQELRDEIHYLATQLAERLRERTDLNEHSGFSTDDLYHVVDVIDRAGDANGHYTGWVQEPLQRLEARFDLKYWPSLPDLLEVIADDAATAEIAPTDHITEAGTASPKRSKADAARALIAAIERARTSPSGQIAPRFHLSDESHASMLNVALNLGENELIDGAYIKRLRQRDRDARVCSPRAD